VVIRLLILASLVGCGYPRPADVPGGDDDGGVCVPRECPVPAPCGSIDDGCNGRTTCGEPCAVFAIERSLANAGEQIAIEGELGETATVRFPGGVDQEATILGTQRARVEIPAGATAGTLSVSTGGSSFVFPFQRAGFELGIQPFRARFEQTDVARPMPRLALARTGSRALVTDRFVYVIGGGSGSLIGGPRFVNIDRAAIHADGTLGSLASSGVALANPRSFHAVVAIGGHVYVLGGNGGPGGVFTIERATVTDGVLGAFAVQAPTLSTIRFGHTAHVIGRSVYVIGGAEMPANGLTSIERATIANDGTLGPFQIVDSVNLRTARFGHSSAVIGDFLYVFGGNSGMAQGVRATVERAAINPDGTLGQFETVNGLTLVTARQDHTTVVLGGFVYMIGGRGAGPIATIERAAINADGTLGAFAVVSNRTLVTPRSGSSHALVNEHLYVVGGEDAAVLASVERASFDASGALGAFAPLQDTAIPSGHIAGAAAVVGRKLFVAGGNIQLAVAGATIAPDGAIGAFAAESPLSLQLTQPSVAVIDRGLFVLGGLNLNLTGRVERAVVDDAGVLGGFSLQSSLAVPRVGARAVAIENFLYVLGGGEVSTLVERATINPDGTLTAFATVAGVDLARTGFTIAVIGDSLFVVGGTEGGTERDDVLRATIAADGSLSAFAPVAGVTLDTARTDHASSVIGGFLYVYGGRAGVSALSSIERAPINPDGSLGTFAAVGDLGEARGNALGTITNGTLCVFGGSPLGLEQAPRQ
jgi:hypothetical protein